MKVSRLQCYPRIVGQMKTASERERVRWLLRPLVQWFQTGQTGYDHTELPTTVGPSMIGIDNDEVEASALSTRNRTRVSDLFSQFGEAAINPVT